MDSPGSAWIDQEEVKVADASIVSILDWSVHPVQLLLETKTELLACSSQGGF
jgi:hypothetical protein